MKVQDVYYADITSSSEETPIKNVIRAMMLTRFFAMPIVNQDNYYVGCIDISDIISSCIPHYVKALTTSAYLPDVTKFYENLKKIQDKQIKEFMPKQYPTLKLTDSLQYAADLLERSNRRTLPVVENRTLVGILTRLELISVLLKMP